MLSGHAVGDLYASKQHHTIWNLSGWDGMRLVRSRQKWPCHGPGMNEFAWMSEYDKSRNWIKLWYDFIKRLTQTGSITRKSGKAANNSANDRQHWCCWRNTRFSRNLSYCTVSLWSILLAQHQFVNSIDVGGRSRCCWPPNQTFLLSIQFVSNA